MQTTQVPHAATANRMFFILFGRPTYVIHRNAQRVTAYRSGAMVACGFTNQALPSPCIPAINIMLAGTAN